MVDHITGSGHKVYKCHCMNTISFENKCILYCYRKSRLSSRSTPSKWCQCFSNLAMMIVSNIIIGNSTG